MAKQKIKTFLITGFGRNSKATKEENAVKEYFIRRGFDIMTSREIPLGGGFLSNIVSNIKNCQAVIVLLNKARLNISFEAGIIFGKSPLFSRNNLYLGDKTINIDKDFSDLKDVHWIFYRKSNLPKVLREDRRISKWIKDVRIFFRRGNVRKMKKISSILQKFDESFYTEDNKRSRDSLLTHVQSLKRDIGKCL